ncbi:two pore channel protein 2-like [Oscarella lobularis]|uniref:two pore channel protein 2-like n=1 Tax=Oscarella lobularis TaxID=121494 RepID=UPI00331418F9
MSDSGSEGDHKPLIAWRRGKRTPRNRNTIDDLRLKQAVTFIDDAIQYRAIHHKIDSASLKLYGIYYSRPVQWLIGISIAVIFLLTFFERPSSISASSDPACAKRYTPPCGTTEAIEFVCLFIFLIDATVKGYLLGMRRFIRKAWHILYFTVIIISIIDWMVTVGTDCREIAHVTRWRRIFRPVFLLHYSTLMKKTLKSLSKTVPQIMSVMFLLLLHIYFFTMIGMLLFHDRSQGPESSHNGTNHSSANAPHHHNSTQFHCYYTQHNKTHNVTLRSEAHKYFQTLETSMISLLVLLTTANNPDVMIPAYREHRLYALYFIVYLAIGLYLLLNLLTAVIYNQFRGYLASSLQGSFFRRRVGVRAAFEVLKSSRLNSPAKERIDTVDLALVKQVVNRIRLPKQYEPKMHQNLHKWESNRMTYVEFRDYFDTLYLDPSQFVDDRRDFTLSQKSVVRVAQKVIRSRWYKWFQNIVTIANCFVITLELVREYDSNMAHDDSTLAIVNMSFIFYYFFEQLFMLCFLGPREYASNKGNIYDGVVAVGMMVVQIVIFSVDRFPFAHRRANSAALHSLSLWDLYRIVNILIMVRLLRVIPHIKMLRVITGTLADLVKSLAPFMGILVVAYYFFAILGMQCLGNVPKFSDMHHIRKGTRLSQCGTYENLHYFPNNFDDFASSLVVLWDVMVVNNWSVFLEAYSYAVSPWAQLYFIAWWFTSAVVCANLFIALVLEAFISKWDELKIDQTGRRITSVGDETFSRVNVVPGVQTTSIQTTEPSAGTTTDRNFYIHRAFRGNLVEPSEHSIMHELHSHAELVVY